MASVAKIGRSKRSPSNKAYTSGKRWQVNKDKRIKRDALLKATKKVMKVKRGSMRRYKRANIKVETPLNVE